MPRHLALQLTSHVSKTPRVRSMRMEFEWQRFARDIEKFNIRQPPKGEKDDYDSENSWISDGFPSSSHWGKTSFPPVANLRHSNPFSWTRLSHYTVLFCFFHSVGPTLTSYPRTTFCMITTCEQAHYISLHEYYWVQILFQLLVLLSTDILVNQSQLNKIMNNYS